MQPAAVVGAEEDAAAVAAEQAVVARPAALADEQGQVADFGIALPALRLDALALGVGDGDIVLTAAVAAAVAVPVLDDGQVPDGHRHGEFTRGRGRVDLT